MQRTGLKSRNGCGIDLLKVTHFVKLLPSSIVSQKHALLIFSRMDNPSVSEWLKLYFVQRDFDGFFQLSAFASDDN